MISHEGLPNAGRSQRLLQHHKPSSFWLQLLIDIFLALGLLFILANIRHQHVGVQYRTLAIIGLLLMWIFHNYFGVYRRQSDVLGSFYALAKSWTTIAMTLIVLGFATKTSDDYSRQVIFAWLLIIPIVQFAAHHLAPPAIFRMKGPDLGKEPALVIGAHDLGKYLATRINKNPWLNIRIIGVIDDNEEALSNWRVPDVPALGALKDLDKAIDEHNVRSVYITTAIDDIGKVESLYLKMLDLNIDINWVPDIFRLKLINPSVKELAGLPVLALSETPLIGTHALVKRVFDMTLATLILALTSPILIATAIAIKYTSPGPVFYRQKRHGWDGRVFEIWKFRSMDTSVGQVEFKQATKDDPRVTPIGKFIRKTSIDELPQLFNVLQGAMSLVGPRPHPLQLNDQFHSSIKAYFTRHRIKPGITGLAQVSGYRGETESLEKMEKRVEYDLEYINNWSVLLDMKILIKTLFVLFSKNAY